MDDAREFDALLIDLGGVLVLPQNSPERQRHLDRIGWDEAAFETWMWQQPEARPSMRGEITPDEFWMAIGTRLGLTAEEALAMQRDYYAGDELNAEMVGLVRRAREQGMRIGMLSNAYCDLGPYLSRFGVLELFDELVFSAVVGITKPDPAVYALACGKLGVPPERTLFIDDMERNVESARAWGMQALQYVGPETCRAAADLLQLSPGR